MTQLQRQMTFPSGPDKTPTYQPPPRKTPGAEHKGRQVLIYMLNCIPEPVAGVTGQRHETCSTAHPSFLSNTDAIQAEGTK